MNWKYAIGIIFLTGLMMLAGCKQSGEAATAISTTTKPVNIGTDKCCTIWYNQGGIIDGKAYKWEVGESCSDTSPCPLPKCGRDCKVYCIPEKMCKKP